MTGPPIEHRHGDLLISDSQARVDLDALHGFLSGSYWAENIPFETVERSVRNSLCIGCYALKGEQVGFARFISDYATFCYIADVYVLPEYRHRGISKAIMAFAAAHPRLQGLRRWNLVTLDAHGLYSQFGFVSPKHPERYMEKVDWNIYKRPPIGPA